MATVQRGRAKVSRRKRNPGQRPPHPDHWVHSNGTSEQRSDEFYFECPLCDKLKGRANISEGTGEWVISCWSCTDASYLFDLAETLGVHGGGWMLKEDPRKYLAPYITRESNRPSEPSPLPMSDDISAWREMLHEEPKAMRYLLHERDLSRAIIAKYALGYDGRAFTLPILDVRTRKLGNLKRRFWPRLPASGVKYMGKRGREATLYPGLPATGPLVLCEGELDALVLRRWRLPSVTVTTGMATRWRSEWGDVDGRRIAVLYDAGKRGQQQAANRVAELRRMGADAWVVRLGNTGMKDGEDVTDWFVTYGRTRSHLINFMNHEYRSAP